MNPKVCQGVLDAPLTIFDVVRDLLQDENLKGHTKAMTMYLKPDLLIIDDMGLKQLPSKTHFFNRVTPFL